MRLIYDPYIFLYQTFGGISRYYAELISGVGTNYSLSKPFRIIYSDNEIAREHSLCKIYFPLRAMNFKGAYRIHNILFQIEMKRFYNELRKGNYEIYHPSYYDESILLYLPEKKELVITMHDMIHEKFPQYFADDNTIHSKKRLLDRADMVIAVSQNTKNDILEVYPHINESKVRVIPLSCSLRVNRTVQHKSIEDGARYFLYVGSRSTYKNFRTLLLAFKDAFNLNEKIRLLCAGGGVFTADECLKLRTFHLTERVSQLDVKDAELVWLYQNAIALVLSSEYEGFGLPMLEAFECGCPVISSKGGSLPEVGGDAAVYFEPKDSHELKEKLRSIFENDDLKFDLTTKGTKRSTEFSWDVTLNKTVEVYKQLQNSM